MRRKMIFKKVAVPVMGLLLACSVIPATTINADAYECKYVSSAPSDVNRLSFSEVGKASGGDSVPKANVSVKMSGHLKEYASSLSVDAKGTISF